MLQNFELINGPQAIEAYFCFQSLHWGDGVGGFATPEGAILGFFKNRNKFFTRRNYLLRNLNISFTNHLISSCNFCFTKSTRLLN